jgi:hypothetical protein
MGEELLRHPGLKRGILPAPDISYPDEGDAHLPAFEKETLFEALIHTCLISTYSYTKRIMERLPRERTRENDPLCIRENISPGFF